MGFIRACAAALAMTLMAAGTAPAGEPYHLRIGWVVVPSDLAPLMFLKPGLAPACRQDLHPRADPFRRHLDDHDGARLGPARLAALAYSTFALGVENAGMKDLRVIANSFQDGVPGYHTNNFVVRKDSPIHTVEDLKGKVLATNETGSAIDMALRAMLAKHHLQDKRDVTIIEVRFPDAEGDAAGGQGRSHHRGRAVRLRSRLRAFSRTAVHPEQAVGRTQMIMRVARAGFFSSTTR